MCIFHDIVTQKSCRVVTRMLVRSPYSLKSHGGSHISYHILYLNTIGIKAECLWGRVKIISLQNYDKIGIKLLTIYNYNKNSKKIQCVNIFTPGFKT